MRKSIYARMNDVSKALAAGWDFQNLAIEDSEEYDEAIYYTATHEGQNIEVKVESDNAVFWRDAGTEDWYYMDDLQ